MCETVYILVSVQEIHKKLEELSSRDHSAYNAFILVILSHGTEDGVYGMDDQLISLDDIKNLFDGEKCRSLNDKPKMFFIQACQGGEHCVL